MVLTVKAINVVEKFGKDGVLERSWQIPPEAAAQLRAHVEMTDKGWIMYVGRVTAEIAAVLQPSVSEPIDVASDRWYISSEQV
jgi:hypothetical protein